MEPLRRLTQKYGYDEPIFTEEILSDWSEYSRPRVFQLLKKYTDCGALAKFDKGVYYVPTQTFLGTVSSLSPRSVIEKKYLKSNGEVYGYYGGLSLLNGLNLTTLVPNTYEVVTMKEATRMRRIQLGRAKVILRKARVAINSQNVAVLQLLDAFYLMGRQLDDDELDGVRRFIQAHGIKERDVFKYAGDFPAGAIKNLLATGVEYVFAP